MNFIQRFKENKVKSPTIKIKFPVEDPELEFEIYRVTTIELRELYKPMLADSENKQVKVDFTFNMFDKLMTKLKDVQPLNGSEFEYNPREIEDLKNTFNMSDMIDFVNVYSDCYSKEEAEVAGISEKNE